MKFFLANGAFKISFAFVRLEMPSQSRVVKKALVTHVALEWLGLIVAMNLVMLGEAIFGGKALVAEAALVDPLLLLVLLPGECCRRARPVFRIAHSLRFLPVSFWWPSLSVHSHMLNELSSRRKLFFTLRALLKLRFGLCLSWCDNRVKRHMQVQKLGGVEHEPAVRTSPRGGFCLGRAAPS